MKLLNLGLPRPRPLPIVNCQGTRSTPLSSRTPTVPGLILKLTSFEAYRRSVDYICTRLHSPYRSRWWRVVAQLQESQKLHGFRCAKLLNFQDRNYLTIYIWSSQRSADWHLHTMERCFVPAALTKPGSLLVAGLA